MSKRTVAIVLVMEIEDGAILCKDDPDQYDVHVKPVGDDQYVKQYIENNFKEMFQGFDVSDQGAWENVNAYATLKTVTVTE